jgi:hypothetical protein
MKPQLPSFIPSGQGFGIKSKFVLKAFHVILLGLFIIATAQKVTAQTSPQWVLGTTVEKVQCYYAMTQCDGVPAVLLKFVNERSAVTKISWDSKVTTNLSQPTVNPKGRQTAFLSWGLMEATDCSVTDAFMYITASQIDESCTQISQFSFQNITID